MVEKAFQLFPILGIFPSSAGGKALYHISGGNRIMPYPRSILAALSVAQIFLSPILRAQIPAGITFAPAFGTDGANLFTHPTMMLEIPGKPGTFLVPEMGSGKIWVLAPGASGYTKTLFGTQTGNAVEADMGLTGFAFHPDYVNNRKYYV